MRYESGSKIIGHADHARQQRKYIKNVHYKKKKKTPLHSFASLVTK